ncbi:uncharacterized protein LOC110740151 [Chenopodium quinoa]|uniref:MCM10 OB-fold domain-containing protein n=1 Tax=Chenopodium quinoa TaxID=63459 RepID=A0A803MCD4_CHEQI|nr:uncharacterized protein LOC110740151 [Chenopodium quinoa]
MSTDDQDDLDLLLSLQDRVLETPPSPSSSHPRSHGYQSDDEVRRRSGNLSAFKTAVEDCMDYDVETATKALKSKKPTDLDVEKFSGLRIRGQWDTLSGSWATVGVLTEKTSSTGKSYSMWKIGCLDGQFTTVFLFGDAYKQHGEDTALSVFAFFNAGARKDSSV